MTFGDTLPDTILKSKSKEEQKYEACAANWQLMEEQQIVVQWANYPPYTNHPFLLTSSPPSTLPALLSHLVPTLCRPFYPLLLNHLAPPIPPHYPMHLRLPSLSAGRGTRSSGARRKIAGCRHRLAGLTDLGTACLLQTKRVNKNQRNNNP